MRAHVDPGLRHRDHDIGEAEAEPFDQHDALVGVRRSVSRTRSSPVTPRCTAPCAKLRGDFGGREIGDLDAVEPGDRAAIVARAARLDQRQAGAREERLGVFLQPALGRHGEDAAARSCARLR